MASPTGQTGHARYPAQFVLLVEPDVHARIAAEATQHRLSKSEIGRLYLEAGLDAQYPVVAFSPRSEATLGGKTQLIVMLKQGTYRAIETQAEALHASKGVVGRALIRAGMDAADQGMATS